MVPSPSVSHQEVSKRLLMALVGWVENRGLGKVYDAPLDVVLSEHDVVQPDLPYVSRDRQGIIKEADIWGAPDLVAEILSSSTTRWDREIKREVYARFGVRELWLVDPQARSIEVATLKDGEFMTLQACTPGTTPVSPVLPGFTFDVGALFA